MKKKFPTIQICLKRLEKIFDNSSRGTEMFIKNIVIGILGLIVFPTIEMILSLLGIDTQKGIFLISGIAVSLSMIAYYFVNVYVIGKSRSFFTISSSWLILISTLLPFAYLPSISTIYISDISLNIVFLYASLASIIMSWLMVFVEVFRSGTFRAY